MENNEKRSLPIRVVGKAYRVAERVLLDLNAYYNFMAERRVSQKKPKNRKIRVGFIVQYIPAWNKSEPLYKLLRSDDRFETFLLCVQNGIKDGILQEKSCQVNDVYDWFIEQGYDEAVNTYEGNEKWLDLNKLNLDYIFYPRPYNSFMPRQYWSRYVSKYTKICSIMYAVTNSTDVYDTLLNRDFFRNVSFYFAETEEAREWCMRKYSFAHKIGYIKTICAGITSISQISADACGKSSSWNFSKSKFRILWTPRWTTDFKVGGSNFFTYKDEMVKYAVDNPQVDILIRPHPLMFDHFAETGEFTIQERNAYFRTIDSLPNIDIDKQREYGSTFWESNVLVGDNSGILIEYLVTGKPLIFCKTNFYLTPSAIMKKIMKCSYVVDNKEELFDCLKKLQCGEDTLRDERVAFAKALIAESEQSVGKIRDVFIEL